MFALPSTPTPKTRQTNWSSIRYNSTAAATANATPTPNTTTTTNSLVQPIDIELEIDPQLTQSQTSSPPTSSLRQTIPSSSPFVHHQRIISTSPPPSLERNLHTSPMQPPYPNTPSPQSYGLSGTVIVNEPSSIMQSHASETDCGSHSHSQSDVFMSHAVPKNSKPALRPSLSHNGVQNAPSPSWPRRVMTTGSSFPPPPLPTYSFDDRLNGNSNNNISNVRQQSVPLIAPAVNFSASTSSSSAVSDNNNTSNGSIVHGNNHHQNQNQTQSTHEVDTPYLSNTSSTNSTTNTNTSHPHHHLATHPYPHPHPHPHQTYYTHPHEEHQHQQPHYPGPISYDGYPSSTTSPWQQPMSTILPSHHHQQQQQSPYHWGMHHMAIPQKQDEPILAPGELPAPRPPMSYAALIGEALLLAPPPHQLYVSEISDSIKKRYPYYRQNPTKIYNGVRHQTSMCKAFVKLPRPFGDQSGGARKWAIRAGCETWFAGGGYHPPSSTPPSTKPPKVGGKAKSTARAKHLIIGTSAEDKKARGMFGGGYPDSGSSGEGPSSGPAYDGSSRPLSPYSQYGQHQASSGTTGYGAPAPPPPNGQHLPPGYHYIPIPPAHGHPQPNQPVYVPIWGPYVQQQGNPNANGGSYYQQQGSESPEQTSWGRGGGNGLETRSNDGTHVSSSYDEVKMMPQSQSQQQIGSPAPSVHSIGRSIHSSHGASPETM
ncbi:uncharacterized protein L199_001876 [Kwoniella botswanensis]|uniref:uncharacterized protein n=1 Tax=Kwoniella botswanensis TaxID=1268659 RepID=UPI00315DCC0D